MALRRTDRRPALRDSAADTVRGIGLVLLAVAVITLGDTAAKWALPAAGVGLVMVGRGVFGVVTILGIVIASAGGVWPAWRRLRPVRWRLLAVRSLLQGVSTMTWYIAWMSMSLVDTFAIGFTAPLLMTLMAVPILGERLRWRRMAATVIGFGGVLIMVRPGGDLWHPVVAVLFAGIALMSLIRILTRLLSLTERPESIALWLLVAQIPCGLLLLPLFPVRAPLDAGVWIALAILGVTNAVANWLYARALALAPVAAIAPYDYTSLIWGGLFGFLAFGDLPSWTTLAGAVVVAAAGLYNLHRERQLRSAEQAASLVAGAGLAEAGGGE